MRDVMTTSEVSEETGVPAETLRWWRSIERGPKSFNIGRKVFYRRADVEAWLADQYSASVRGGAA